VRLELGAGYRPTPGYVHNDLNSGPDIEIVCDARDIVEHVGEKECEEVRATHLLEHFSHRETVNVLRSWKKLLQPGGMLYLEVPHIFGHVAALSRGEITEDEFVVYVYGEQDFEGNAHFAGFSSETLYRKLDVAGYTLIDVKDIGMVLIAEARRSL
jgi:hypothetical protein